MSNQKPVFKSFQEKIPSYECFSDPYVFSSMLCREQHFHLPLFSYWCKKIGEKPRFHRKQWEFVYIAQVLHERGFLREGALAIGFGVGKEPLVSLFASEGVSVIATDLVLAEAEKLGWVSTNQRSENLASLNERNLCEPGKFDRLVNFKDVNMNHIPQNIGKFDMCWSSCAFEHLGSIRKGLDFVKNSSMLLKPGGIGVHTTEYNISSNDDTLDNNPGLVIFRKRDIEQMVYELKMDGYMVDPIDFNSGEDELDHYIDMPPFCDEPHLRLQLAEKFVCSSLGLIVRAPE